MTPDELKARGLRVKPLVWVLPYDGRHYGPVSEAEEYQISAWSRHEWRLYLSTTADADVICNLGVYPTPDAAKAAAETHYAAQIAAMIERIEE